MSEDLLLSVKGLKQYFPVQAGFLRHKIGEVRAVDGVDLEVRKGKVVGLVGESGSGKSTLARSIIRLIEPTEGQITYLSRDVMQFDKRALNSWRREVQMVFQNPHASLNPRKTVGEALTEPLLYHRLCSGRDEAVEIARHLLQRVGLTEGSLYRYPHMFSGGQQQRICIARALALKPRLIICDEAVSALDVSVQAQILNLLHELKAEFELSYLFIAHDLAIVRNFCDEVIVLYLGQVMERASTEALFAHPSHPYTRALLAAIPSDHPSKKTSPQTIKGDPPSPLELIHGCPFRTRCPYVREECTRKIPWQEISVGHHCRCILPAAFFSSDDMKEVIP